MKPFSCSDFTKTRHQIPVYSINLFILILVCFASCTHKNDNGRFWGDLEEMGYPMQADSVNLVKMDESVFGEAISLKGEYIPIEPLIKPAELEAFIKDSLLFLKHLGQKEGEPLLHVLKLPSLGVVAELAKRGTGPEEVIDIRLIESHDESFYCFVHDVNKNLLYKVDKKLNFSPFYKDKIIPENAGGIKIGSEGIVHLGDSNFLFPQMADDGMGIFEMNLSDKIAKGRIKLNCSDNIGAVWAPYWSCYLGNLCSNQTNRCLAYAYTFYHRILFADFKGDNIKVVQFEEQAPFQSKDSWHQMNTGQDVCYYIGAFGSSNYTYFLYRGCNYEKEPNCVYLEQWTWDGKPVKRFELEKGMYPLGGCVDEKTSTLYLLDVTKDDFIYKVQMGNDKI